MCILMKQLLWEAKETCHTWAWILDHIIKNVDAGHNFGVETFEWACKYSYNWIFEKDYEISHTKCVSRFVSRNLDLYIHNMCVYLYVENGMTWVIKVVGSCAKRAHIKSHRSWKKSSIWLLHTCMLIALIRGWDLHMWITSNLTSLWVW